MNRKLAILSVSTVILAVFLLPRLPSLRSEDQRTMKEALNLPTDKITRTEEEWKMILTPEQYRVTRLGVTEPAFTGEYHKQGEKGIYRCVGCGIPLFGSEAKYDSGTGWPSFLQPLKPESIWTREDRSLWIARTEVLCSRCDAHLGHVFPRPGTHGAQLLSKLNCADFRSFRTGNVIGSLLFWIFIM